MRERTPTSFDTDRLTPHFNRELKLQELVGSTTEVTGLDSVFRLNRCHLYPFTEKKGEPLERVYNGLSGRRRGSGVMTTCFDGGHGHGESLEHCRRQEPQGWVRSGDQK